MAHPHKPRAPMKFVPVAITVALVAIGLTARKAEPQSVAAPQGAATRPPFDTGSSHMPMRYESRRMIDLLKLVRNAEEEYYTAKRKYTASIDVLRAMFPPLTIPEALSIKSLTIGTKTDGYVIVVTSTRMNHPECALAIGLDNPIAASAGEGEPICR